MENLESTFSGALARVRLNNTPLVHPTRELYLLECVLWSQGRLHDARLDSSSRRVKKKNQEVLR